MEGKYVKLADMLRSFNEIVEGKAPAGRDFDRETGWLILLCCDRLVIDYTRTSLTRLAARNPFIGRPE